VDYKGRPYFRRLAPAASFERSWALVVRSLAPLPALRLLKDRYTDSILKFF